MSHFSVIVLSAPGEKLEEQLAPFHEFECTGLDNQYVQDVDITEEARKKYAEQTETYYRLLDGTLVPSSDPMFFRDPTPEEEKRYVGHGIVEGVYFTSRDWGDGRGYRAKVKFKPEGAEEVEVPVSHREPFAQWAADWYGKKFARQGEGLDHKEHKFGYVLIKPTIGAYTPGECAVVKVVRRTNPNAKWDWYQVGGRWSGFFTGVNPAEDPRNQEICFLCGGTGRRDDEIARERRRLNPDYTCNGCGGEGISTKWPTQWVSEGNVLPRGLLDVDKLRAVARGGRQACVDKLLSVSAYTQEQAEHAIRLQLASDEEWRALPESRPYGDALTAWVAERPDWAPIAAPAWRKALFEAFYGESPQLKVGQTLDQWVLAAPIFPFFALLRGQEWHEKGKMYAFGVSEDRVDPDDWNAWVEKTILDAPPETTLTVVDCHI